MAKEKKIVKIEKPEIGEATKNQTGSGVSTVSSFPFPEISTGTFETYRRMRGNPTIALARMVATAPIRTASWSVEARDDADDNMVALVQDNLQQLWPQLIKDVLFALDYGFSPFEKVWVVKDGKLVYKKLKPLLVDNTKILVDINGGFAGFRQDALDLVPEKCFLFTHDGEAGDLYGRSRHENIRKDAWMPWIDTAEKRKAYIKKVAGTVPMVEYPEGVSRDATGQELSNFEIAKKILASLGVGDGVAMPNVFAKYAGDLAKSGIDINQLKAWQISFLETKGSQSSGMTEVMRHCESLIMRGWLVPERTAIEGQYGTKAEAGEHAEIALILADLLLQDIISVVNAYLVNPLLYYNWGESAKGLVYIKKSGLAPELKLFFRDIIKTVLTAPSNVDLFLGMVDVDALLDNTEIPKVAEVIDANNIERTPKDENQQGDALSRAVSRIYKGIYTARGA
jgi:hypothetical protein